MDCSWPRERLGTACATLWRMQRIDHPTADPNANGPGKAGFSGGDPVAMVPATILTPEWANVVQEELANAVEQYEPLDPARNNQLASFLATLGPSNALLPLNNTWTGSNEFTQHVRVAQRLGLSDNAEVIYVDSSDLPAPKVIWTSLSIAGGTGPGTQYDPLLGPPGVTFAGAAMRVYPLESMIPTTAQFAGCGAVFFNPAGGGTTTFTLQLVSVGIDPFTGDAITTTLWTKSGNCSPGAFLVLQDNPIPTPWHTVDRSTWEYQLRVISSNAGQLRRIHLGIAQPGPRNW